MSELGPRALRLGGAVAAVVLAAGALVLVAVNVAAAQALSGEPVTSGVLEDVRDELGETEALVPVELVATVLTGLERRANDRALEHVRDASLVAGLVLLPLSALAGLLVSAWWVRRSSAPGGDPASAPSPDVLGPAGSPDPSLRRLVEEASHELRNPLAVITTNLDLVVSAPPDTDPADVHRAAQSARRAAQRMAATLDGLTTAALAGGAAGAEPLVLDAVVASVAEEFGPPAGARGLRIVRMPGGPDATVRGDRLALRRAVANLVANAVRLAPQGSEIRCGAGAVDGWVWCGVADEGPGIGAEHQGRIFERGWHGAEGGGAGLGLWIVRQVAESHGGCARVHSALGVGTHLLLWLPAADDADSRSPEPPGLDPLGPL